MYSSNKTQLNRKLTLNPNISVSCPYLRPTWSDPKSNNKQSPNANPNF